MALSFVQEPIGDSTKSPVITNWTPLVPYTLHRDASIAALFYYKLVLEVRIDDASGELLAKIKQRRNGLAADVTSNLARATFDLRDIVNSQLEDTIYDNADRTKTIHKVGANTASAPFSVNTNQVKKIYVKGYENYSSASNTSPGDVTGDAVNDTKFYIGASLDLNTARGTADFQDTAFATYSLDGSSKLFLSDVQEQGFNLAVSGTAGRLNYIQETDYHTIGFLNGVTDFASDVYFVGIKFYDSSGNVINSPGGTAIEYIANTNANGGANPDTEVDDNTKRLLYFGCGAANLEAQSRNTEARPSGFSNWAFYTVTAYDSDATTPKSDTYYFIKQDGSCKGFKVRRLAWRNSKGCYDYFNFKMKSTQTIEVKRNNYETMLGDFSNTMYLYNNFARGKNTRNTTAILKETIQTDWITEADAVLLENLIMSTNVQIVQNADTDYTVPVMVTDNSFIKKTVANDKMIKYTINIEYANPVNTNS
jgi:hypothetical protein|tara:strand:+ start:98 stop:1537 length:1440 start_codon:yes stop_codon:yes gene_type:complete